MKRYGLIFVAILALSGLASAQGFGIGLGLGFFRQDAGGNLVISAPLNLPLANFDEIGLGVRANVDFIFSQKPNLSILLSPLLSYTLYPTDFTPITLYAGPSVRVLIRDVLANTRQTSWSFVGGIAGAAVSLLGFLTPYAEATLNLEGSSLLFSIQVGVGF